MSGLDGNKQRNALTAAEQALRALGSGRPDRARKNAAKAAELDQIGVFASFASAVEAAAADLADGGPVSAAHWDGIAVAVGPGPLAFLVDEIRSGAGDG